VLVLPDFHIYTASLCSSTPHLYLSTAIVNSIKKCQYTLWCCYQTCLSNIKKPFSASLAQVRDLQLFAWRDGSYSCAPLISMTRPTASEAHSAQPAQIPSNIQLSQRKIRTQNCPQGDLPLRYPSTTIHPPRPTL
jgi:hypothetical protein